MEPTTRCPLCFEVIQARAVRCKHCQADLRHVDPPAQAQWMPQQQLPAYTPPPAPPSWGPPAPVTANNAYAPTPPGSQGQPGQPGSQSPSWDPMHPPTWEQSGSHGAPPPWGHPGASAPRVVDAIMAPPSGGAPPHGADGSGPVAAPPSPSPPREAELVGYTPPAEGDFEQRFLDFAFRTTVPISGASVAYALKVPIDEAISHLEDLAARDVLIREVDGRGFVFFQLPGRQYRSASSGADPSGGTALAPYAHPPALLYDPPPPGMLVRSTSESTALVALLVNALCPPPGIGSLIGGKTSAGVFQILLFVVGLVFCASVVGLPVGVPMVFGSWIWGLVTGVNALNESKQNPQPR